MDQLKKYRSGSARQNTLPSSFQDPRDPCHRQSIGANGMWRDQIYINNARTKSQVRIYIETAPNLILMKI